MRPGCLPTAAPAPGSRTPHPTWSACRHSRTPASVARRQRQLLHVRQLTAQESCCVPFRTLCTIEESRPHGRVLTRRASRYSCSFSPSDFVVVGRFPYTCRPSHCQGWTTRRCAETASTWSHFGTAHRQSPEGPDCSSPGCSCPCCRLQVPPRTPLWLQQSMEAWRHVW